MLKSRQKPRCIICECVVEPENKSYHERSKPHLLRLIKHTLSTKEEELLKDKEGLRTVCDETEEKNAFVTIRCAPEEFATVTIQIHSDRYDVVFEMATFLESDKQICILNPPGDSRGQVIQRGSSYELQIKAESAHRSSRIYPLIMRFSRQGLDQILFVRYVRVSCVDATIACLEPESSFSPIEPLPQLPQAKKIIRVKVSNTCAGREDGCSRPRPAPIRMADPENDEYEDMLPRTEQQITIKLNYYPAPNTLTRLHLEGLEETPDMDEQLKEYLAGIKEKLNIGIDPKHPENYDKYFQILLHCEDIQQEADIRLYDKVAAELIPFDDDIERFEIEVEGLAEGRPSLLPYDKIYVRKQDSDIEYEGFIHRIRSKSVEIIMSVEFIAEYDKLTGRSSLEIRSDDSEDSDDEKERSRLKNVLFGVRFSVNRKVMRLMFRALDQYKELFERNSNINKLLIPEIAWPSLPAVENLGDLDLVNKQIADNPEQLCAVRNIVLGSHRPAPYILFGPPGTGKTTTISEAIIQVYKVLPLSRILVVTPSNSAANVVAEKILKSGAVPSSDIFRLYGVTCHELKSTPDLIKISNWKASEKKFEECSQQKVMQYRIVACTLSMSGALVTMGIKRGFFTHIFIDEAGHAMEPEALIPIVGLLEIHDPHIANRVGGSVILSGDHLQLGPVIRSPIARSYTLVRSMLERLMLREPYSRKSNHSFNPMMLTKLVRNFRSHDDILEVPNALFYEGELQAFGDKVVTHSLSLYGKLPQSGTPVIFHAVHGRELRESSNPSFFNLEEISAILEYIRHLLDPETLDYEGKPINQSDIGIIAPYRKQVLKIRQILNMYEWNDITVGSTEEFQGQERLIMFISTVRCSSKAFDAKPSQSLGFLKNRKRFNVATTRAKALMIIVGDPRVLNQDYCWRKLLEFCRDRGAWCGERFVSDYKEFDDLFAKLEKLEISLGLKDLQGVKLGVNGQVTITDLSMQEEPKWRDEE